MCAFSSFMRDYLNSVVKADQCAQYVDDLEQIAANYATDFTRNVQEVLRCIPQARLEIATEKSTSKV